MSPAFEEARIELACFEVHGQRYGIDVQQIREIVRAQTVTPLPRAPGLIEGVIDLRGAIIPVVDAGRALGREAIAESPKSRIVIVEVEGLVFGLRVDAAAEVIVVSGSEIGDAPPLVTHTGYETVRAVVRREGEPPTLMLSLEHLLESVYRSALAHGGSAAVETPAPASGS
ncbi:chemotaxis protein CheW [Myxococcota bacterium]|nr:chemotaxis protein CheW [Myxococcota bacterium]MCZ7618571.1 chemotaxis protein CheW [Myxococcota bacterium]